jgi:uncharacterized protein (TIGR02996 family)
MHTDQDFLRTLLENPADDTTRLVYADWLDEQDDPTARAKAAFLRLTAQLRTLGKKQRQKRKLLGRQLQELAAGLDTDWLAVVSRLQIENCAGERDAERHRFERQRSGRINLLRQFDFVCDKRWDELIPLGDRAVRFCEGCRQNVHYCDTITEARRHAWDGHCIAVDLGVIRRERDLEPRLLVLGMPGPDFYRREDERLQPDPVSAERERKKQERARG